MNVFLYVLVTTGLDRVVHDEVPLTKTRRKLLQAPRQHGIAGIGERSDAVLRTAMPGNDEIE